MWSPAGSQAVYGVVWQISALGLCWLLIPFFGSVCVGGRQQPATDLLAHPREVSGVGAQLGF